MSIYGGSKLYDYFSVFFFKDSNKSGSYEELDDDEDDVDDRAQGPRPLNIKVEKGDITKVTCDCIVNSSNDQLDLTKGKPM